VGVAEGLAQVVEHLPGKCEAQSKLHCCPLQKSPKTLAPEDADCLSPGPSFGRSKRDAGGHRRLGEETVETGPSGGLWSTVTQVSRFGLSQKCAIPINLQLIII
jgi:hypothetical protein